MRHTTKATYLLLLVLTLFSCGGEEFEEVPPFEDQDIIESILRKQSNSQNNLQQASTVHPA